MVNKVILMMICFLLFISIVKGAESFWIVVDCWLTDNKIADFNKDGIVNFKDFALIQSYGSDEYGIDAYGI